MHHLPHLVLTVGSFFPCIYYGFFCDPHLQAFYLTCICLAGLGKCSPCASGFPVSGRSGSLSFAGEPPADPRDGYRFCMLNLLMLLFTTSAHWYAPHRGIIHRSKPGIPQADASRCAHEGFHPSRPVRRHPDPAWTRNPRLLHAVLRDGVRMASALWSVLHHWGTAVVCPSRLRERGSYVLTEHPDGF